MYDTAPALDIEKLKQTRDLVGIPIVLHGGSGIPDNQIREAIANGVAKINVNTENRLAYSNTLKDYIRDNPDDVVPYKLGKDAIQAVKDITLVKIRLFGSENKSD